ncbi:hypothetical protein CFB46_32035 [Burkholderia sp. HI2761]|nr:hypothetical protein [Burkholderia sp. BE24]OXJ21527.1 hypothetical protein CFB46_32035 [Burkholderia sp. HI2761]
MHAAGAAWRDFECTEAVGVGTGAIRSACRGGAGRSGDRYEKQSCADQCAMRKAGDAAACASIRSGSCVTAGFR